MWRSESGKGDKLANKEGYMDNVRWTKKKKKSRGKENKLEMRKGEQLKEFD